MTEDHKIPQDAAPRPPEMPAAIAECLANAEDLLRGAHALVNRELPRLAYHLAVLALEEIGKASIFGMHRVSARHGSELPPFIAEAAGSHVRKLFWAIWGPSLGQERITVDQIEANRGLAQRLHERRVRSLYVDASEDGLSVPTGTIADEEARSLIRLVEARLEIEKAYDHESGPDAAAQKQSEWFFQGTEDTERRGLIMGARSMDKLKELGSVAAWIAALRNTFEKQDAEIREAIEREMRRAPDDPAAARDKWIVTVRLYSESNSIRQKPLNDWNSGIRWIKLRAVSDKKDQLLVDFHVTTETTLEHLWRGGFGSGTTSDSNSWSRSSAAMYGQASRSYRTDRAATGRFHHRSRIAAVLVYGMSATLAALATLSLLNPLPTRSFFPSAALQTAAAMVFVIGLLVGVSRTSCW